MGKPKPFAARVNEGHIKEIGFRRFRFHSRIYDVLCFQDRKKDKLWVKVDQEATCKLYLQRGWKTLARLLKQKKVQPIVIDFPLKVYNPEKNFEQWT